MQSLINKVWSSLYYISILSDAWRLDKKSSQPVDKKCVFFCKNTALQNANVKKVKFISREIFNITKREYFVKNLNNTKTFNFLFKRKSHIFKNN